MTTKVWGKKDTKKYSQYDDSELSGLHPELLKMLGNIRGKHVVDYGCGEGKLLEELLARGAIVHGYDISSTMIEEARERIGGRGELKAIKSGKMPLDGGSVDCVVSNLVLMMCPNMQIVENIFKEAHRVLKTEGRWIYCVTHPAFSEHDFTTYRNIFLGGMDYFREGQPYQFVLKKKDGREITAESFIDHHYSLSAYLNLLPKTGFRLEEFREVPVEGNKFPPYIIIKGRK